MKRALSLILALLLVMSGMSLTSFAATSAEAAQSSASSTSSTDTVVAYMNATEWAHYADHPNNLSSDMPYIDVINYHPNQVGSGYGGAPLSGQYVTNVCASMNTHRNICRQYNKNIKFVLTIANMNIAMFESWLVNSSTADSFASALVGYVQSFDFDGLDIDFEFPSNLSLRPGFVALYASLRTRLNALSLKTGKQYILTMATPCTNWAFEKFDVVSLANYVDWFNIMNYDLYIGSYFNPYTHHTAPTFDNWSGAPYGKNEAGMNVGGSVAADIELYLTQGVPSQKIVPGAGPYANRWVGAGVGTTGMPGYAVRATFDVNTCFHYDYLITHAMNGVGRYNETKSGYTYYWDNISKAGYLFNKSTGEFIPFDDHLSCHYKSELVNYNNCRGLMVFDYCTCDGVGLFKGIKSWLKGEDHLHILSEYKCGYKNCALCGYEEGSHSFGNEYVEGGKTYHKCSICETVEEVPVVHNWGAWKVTTDPKCTTEGVETRYCQGGCGIDNCTASETRAVAPLNHDMSDAVETIAAKCLTDGEKTAVCKRCKLKVTETIKALGHDMSGAKETIKPWCTTPGEKTATCSRCKNVVKETIDALGHDWSEWTVSGENEESRTCARCQANETRSTLDYSEYWEAQRSLVDLEYAVVDGDLVATGADNLTNPMVKFLNKNNITCLDGFNVVITPDAKVANLTLFWTNDFDRYNDVNEWSCDVGEMGTGEGNYIYGVIRKTYSEGEMTAEFVLLDFASLGWYNYPGTQNDGVYDQLFAHVISDGSFWGSKNVQINIPMGTTLDCTLINHYVAADESWGYGININGTDYYFADYASAFETANEDYYFGVLAYTQGTGSASFTLDKIEDDETTWDYGSHRHSYENWKVTTPAGCLTTGIETGYCSCGKTEERVIDALGHDWSDWAVKGIKKSRTCARCKEVDERFVQDYTEAWEGSKNSDELAFDVASGVLGVKGASNITNPMAKLLNKFNSSSLDGFTATVTPSENTAALALFWTTSFDQYNEVNEWSCDESENGFSDGSIIYGMFRTTQAEGEYSYSIVFCDYASLGWFTYPGTKDDGVFDQIFYHAVVNGAFWGSKNQQVAIEIGETLNVEVFNQYNEEDEAWSLGWYVNGTQYNDVAFAGGFEGHNDGYYFGVLAATNGKGDASFTLDEICGDTTTYDYGKVHTHEYIYTEVSPASCTAAGLEKGVCSCGKEDTRAIPALGHDWGEWVVKGETKSRTCQRKGCGVVETKAAVADLEDYWYTDSNDDSITFKANNNDVTCVSTANVAGALALALTKNTVELEGFTAKITPAQALTALTLYWTNMPESYDEVSENAISVLGDNGWHYLYGIFYNSYEDGEYSYCATLCDFIDLGWYTYEGTKGDNIFDQVMYCAVADGNFWSNKNAKISVPSTKAITVEAINRYDDEDEAWALGLVLNGTTVYNPDFAGAYQENNDGFYFGVLAYNENGKAGFSIDTICEEEDTAGFEGFAKHHHNYAADETTPASCTDEGLMTYTCACGDSYTEVIPALGHDFGEWTTKGNIMTRKCSRCPVTETAKIDVTVDVNDYWFVSANDEAIDFVNETGDIAVKTTGTVNGSMALILSKTTVDLDGFKATIVPKQALTALTLYWTNMPESYDEATENAISVLGDNGWHYLYGIFYNAYEDGEYSYCATLCEFIDLGWHQYEGTKNDGIFDQVMFCAVANGSFWGNKNATIAVPCDEAIEVELLNRYNEEDEAWSLGLVLNGEVAYNPDFAGAYEANNEGYNFGVLAYNENGNADFTLDVAGEDPTTADFGKEEEEEPECDHSYGAWQTQTPASCFTAGKEIRYCTKCLVAFETRDIDAIGSHNWGAWVTAKDGLSKTRKCSRCQAEETEDITPVDEPRFTVVGYVFNLLDTEGVSAIRIAKGNYTTVSAIKAAAGVKTFTGTAITERIAEGTFSYEVATAGEYTAFVKNEDGQYFLHFTVETGEPGVDDSAFPTFTNLEGVKDFYVAKGHYTTYREVKNNLVIGVTAAKYEGKHEYKYAAPLPGAGEYTVILRYEDPTKENTVIYFNYDVPAPVVSANGLKIQVTDVEGIKCIRMAKGSYSTTQEVKKAAGCVTANAAAVAKNTKSGVYTFDFGSKAKAGDVYSVAIIYANGYYEVQNVTLG